MTKLKSKMSPKYKYELYTEVYYRGVVYEKYSNEIGKIIKRSYPKGKPYYKVQFNVDGKILEFTESVLEEKNEQIELKFK